MHSLLAGWGERLLLCSLRRLQGLGDSWPCQIVLGSWEPGYSSEEEALKSCWLSAHCHIFLVASLGPVKGWWAWRGQ